MAESLIEQKQIRSGYRSGAENDHRVGNGSGAMIADGSLVYISDDLANIRLRIQNALGPGATFASGNITHTHDGSITGGPLVVTRSLAMVGWLAGDAVGTPTVSGTAVYAAAHDHRHPNYLEAKYVYRKYQSGDQTVASGNNLEVTGVIGSSVVPISSVADAEGVVSEAMTTASNALNTCVIRNTSDAAILDGSSREIYGRLRSVSDGAGGYDHFIDFYVDIAGTETAHSFGSSQVFTFTYVRQYDWDNIIAGGSHKDVFLATGGVSAGAGADSVTLDKLNQLRAEIQTTPTWSGGGSATITPPLQTQIANHLADAIDPHTADVIFTGSVATQRLASDTGNVLVVGFDDPTPGTDMHFRPDTDNALLLGTSAYRWESVHAVSYLATYEVSGNAAYSVYGPLDTTPRWQVLGNSQHQWGSGTAAPDVTLGRNGVGVLEVTGTHQATVRVNAPVFGTTSGDMTLAPAGGDVLPTSDKGVTLGSDSLRFASFSAAAFKARPDAADTTVVMDVKALTESYPRISASAGGAIAFGRGSAAPECSIYSNAANTLKFYNTIASAEVALESGSISANGNITLTGQVFAGGNINTTGYFRSTGTSGGSYVMGRFGIGIDPVYPLHVLGDSVSGIIAMFAGENKAFSFVQAGSAVPPTGFALKDHTRGALVIYIETDGKIGLGGMSNPASLLSFPAATTATAGLQFGTDTPAVNLYRKSASLLRTDGSFEAGVDLKAVGYVYVNGEKALGRYKSERFSWGGSSTVFTLAQAPIIVSAAPDVNTPPQRILQVFLNGWKLTEGTAASPQDYLVAGDGVTVTIELNLFDEAGDRVEFIYSY